MPVQPWYTWVEPWYLAYALLGTVSAGLLPIVMPLLVSHQGSAADVGIVMAALNVSGLFAPLWGWLADRYRLHRLLLIAGLGLAALGIALFAFVANTLLWAMLALVLNLGVIAAATVANLFIVERHRRAEWDERLGWLQAAYGGGQVIGLALAAFVSQTDLRLGFSLASLSCLIGLLIAGKFAQTPPVTLPPTIVLRHPVKHTDGMFSSPQQLFHHLSLATLRKTRTILATPFSLWLGAWLLAASGAGAFFALYPMVMQQVFAITPGLSSSGFAVAAALGLLLYAPAGDRTHHRGALAMVRQSLAARAVAFALIWMVGGVASLHWMALVFFTFVVLSWSFISVSATAFTAQLAPFSEGEGLGLFNAASALANIIGASLGGWLAVQFGYPAIMLFATIGVALGLAGTFALPQPSVTEQ
ncbi:MFS transporter [Chloroflexus sp.]|uniref:MFS transporter n=1 Tax=Chloroflexus sp. TaxID=1904827 RepID=UPI00298F22AB|nr:MFS transporter [Chloroflexus sp.]MDW8402981.1 MFS transporter [Chloroflexus sp.]